MSGIVSLDVMGYDNRQLASLNARLVVLRETMAQLWDAMLVRPEGAENNLADEMGEKGMEPAVADPGSPHSDNDQAASWR